MLRPSISTNTAPTDSSNQDQHENSNLTLDVTPQQTHLEPPPLPPKPRHLVSDVGSHTTSEESPPSIPPRLSQSYTLVNPLSASQSTTPLETNIIYSTTTDRRHREDLSPEPVHSYYKAELCRLESFSSWPPGLNQQPKELAQAGFFYTGSSDQVKCFYCDGGLESWEPEDSPWGEHCKWFPDCPFLHMSTSRNIKEERKLKENNEKKAGQFAKQIKKQHTKGKNKKKQTH